MKQDMILALRLALGAASVLCAPLMTMPVQAQPDNAYPARPIRILVPSTPGGSVDMLARTIGARIGERWGQQVVVENKSGAAGVTGVDFVAKSGSDAHVIGMMSASAGSIMQHLMPRMPYNPARDIAPVTLMVRVQEILVVNSKLGINDFKGFIDAAKAKQLTQERERLQQELEPLEFEWSRR